ncbi:MAG: hypothetical protein RBR67_09880 [Desulfobacterium sp.]|nr:hypothetical protein [Desulfobacterium sp.]
MEDLSRELEKELKTHARPAPVKKKIKAEFYRIDELGKMTCVTWVLPLICFLILLTLVTTLAAGSFAYLFLHDSDTRVKLVQELDRNDQAIQKLAREKEILMAQLVLSGITPDLEPVPEPGIVVSGENSLHANGVENPEKIAPASDSVAPEGEKLTDTEPPSATVGPVSNDGSSDGSLETMPPTLEIVGIEQIRVVNDKKNGDLLVRFDIKNISADLNIISGYIFVVLKPASTLLSDWLVLPSAPIVKGRPSVFKQGQYFSIAHFKPVNFRGKSSLSPGDFKLATVFVFGEDGGLIAMHDVKLPQQEL